MQGENLDQAIKCTEKLLGRNLGSTPDNAQMTPGASATVQVKFFANYSSSLVNSLVLFGCLG